jgi:hypothetical protein
MAASAAIGLFTPEGERSWAPGWDPVYPGGGNEVFVTRSHGRETFWVTARSEPLSRLYARVTPGVQAGTVEVTCRPEGEGTVAEVRYRLTALDPAAAAELEAFAAGYDEFMAEWERAIAAALEAAG